MYKEQKHYLPPLAALVDIIHKNTGGTGGISMDLVESEMRKFKNQHECMTLVRNIDTVLAVLERGEADLTHFLRQAIPCTGRGSGADAVRRVAGSTVALRGTAAAIDRSWMCPRDCGEPVPADQRGTDLDLTV